MRILVTNDDGVFSPGLAALAQAAARFGEVRVVAPGVEQSSMGQAITSSRPLSWRRTAIGPLEAYRVNGTPADCVTLGASQWGSVDAVLSGVNLGLNLGNSMWHSGTLAAAKQAALLGLRGIALSTIVDEEKPTFERLMPFIHRVLELLLMTETRLPLVNVNLPAAPRGLVWARQAVRHYDGHVVAGEDPAGRKHFWYMVKPIEQAEEGTDVWAVRQGWVALTPLRLDLTDHAELSQARERNPLEDGDAAAARSVAVPSPQAVDEEQES